MNTLTGQIECIIMRFLVTVNNMKHDPHTAILKMEIINPITAA